MYSYIKYGIRSNCDYVGIHIRLNVIRKIEIKYHIREIFGAQALKIAMARRPRSTIDSVILYNEKDEADNWKPTKYTKNSWVLLHPSSKGNFRQKKRAKMTYKSYWKAKILEFKTTPGGQSILEVLVQHVYMHSEIKVHDINPHDHQKCNCKYIKTYALYSNHR